MAVVKCPGDLRGCNTLKHVFNKTAKTGCKIHDVVMISKVEEKMKLNGKDKYLQITISNEFGRLTFPVWDNYEEYKNSSLSNPFEVAGLLSFYQDTPQLTSFKARELSSELNEFDKSYFLPSYDLENNIVEDFKNIISSLQEPFKTFVQVAFFAKADSLTEDENKKLLNIHPCSDMWKKFISAPSAVRHHQNKIHGNLLHTLGVVSAVEYMISNYFSNPKFKYDGFDKMEDFCPDRLRAGALLHDIMKIEDYSYDSAIEKKHTNRKSDHRMNGVSYLSEINMAIKVSAFGKELSDDNLEKLRYMIISHHGSFGNGQHEFNTIEDSMLHLADMIDSQLVGTIESGKFYL